MAKSKTNPSPVIVALICVGCLIGSDLSFQWHHWAEHPFTPPGTAHTIYIDEAHGTATTDKETLDFIAALVKQDPKKKIVTIIGMGGK